MGAIIAVVISAVAMGHNLANYKVSGGHRFWTWVWCVFLIVALWVVFFGAIWR